MADYTVTTWNDNATPAINAANLNKMEAAIKDGAEHVKYGTLASRPPAAAGNKNWIWIDSATGQASYSTGAAWISMTTPEAWTTIGSGGSSFGTGYSAFSSTDYPCRFKKLPDGTVILQGVVNMPAFTFGASPTVLTMPTGYRVDKPSAGRADFLVRGFDQGTPQSATFALGVYPDGTFKLLAGHGYAAFSVAGSAGSTLHLDQIAYPAA
jgi:hypothetical protein